MITESVSEDKIVRRTGSYVIANNGDSGLFPLLLYRSANYLDNGDLEYIGQFADMPAIESYLKVKH